jgi:5-deoxy-glucuronate isomerase
MAAIDLDLIVADARKRITRPATNREHVIVVLSGQCDLQCGSETWKSVGGRSSVFDGRATALYVPAGAEWSVSTKTSSQLAAISTDAESGTCAQFVNPEDVAVETRGVGTYRRVVHTLIGEDSAARRLLVGETFNDPGCWSAFPPHKHDTDGVDERQFHECFYFKMAPPTGFGIMLNYGLEPAWEEAFRVTDGDVVRIPAGYHTIVAAPDVQLYYLWALAGCSRELKWTTDPPIEILQ